MLKPEVTVVCITYNQSNYIRDALDGFLAQETSFPFEIIIHDDASTDETSAIITEYARRFPDIVRPIQQPVNLRKLGISSWKEYIKPAIRGRYVANCEGDDYWTNPLKLQMQYDFLESHKDYSACLHNALIVDYRADCAYLSERDNGDKDKDFKQIILEGGGRLNPTASIFYRLECRGDWKLGPVGDHFLLMSLASRGKIRWLSTPMSVYRFMSEGSWSKRDASSKTISDRRNYHSCYIEALEAMNKATNNVEEVAFSKRIAFQKALLSDEISSIEYANHSLGLRLLLQNVSSTRTALRAICLRYCTERQQKAILSKMQKLVQRRRGVLVSSSVSKLPSWGKPLESR